MGYLRTTSIGRCGKRIIWIVWKARNRIAFEGEELSIQKLKSSFVFYLWSEAKGCLDDVPQTFFSFLDWLGHW